jgi:hypothetical protein
MNKIPVNGDFNTKNSSVSTSDNPVNGDAFKKNLLKMGIFTEGKNIYSCIWGVLMRCTSRKRRLL